MKWYRQVCQHYHGREPQHFESFGKDTRLYHGLAIETLVSMLAPWKVVTILKLEVLTNGVFG